MTKDDAINYFRQCASFRSEKARRSWPGSGAVIKNELYAYQLEKVIDYVSKLPDDHATLIQLRDIERDFLFYDDIDLHAHTIHCSLDKTSDVAGWFSRWVTFAASCDKAEVDTKN